MPRLPAPAPPCRQPQLNDWFLTSRDHESGEFADLPAADKGGSRNIIHPPPPQPPAEPAAAAAKAGKAGAAAGKGKPGAAAGKDKGAAGEEAPRCSQAFLEGLRAAVQQYMDVWLEYEPTDPSVALREWRLCSLLPAARAGSVWRPPPLHRPHPAAVCARLGPSSWL